MDLEQRVHEALVAGILPAIELNNLLQDLARNKETDALVRIWDIRGTRPEIYPETWRLLENLHNLGKGKIPVGTIIMPVDRARLSAPRRLHKIVKGKIISERSEAAKQHIDTAIEYIKSHPELKGKDRSDQVKSLRDGLNVKVDVARGLVTKLKQKSFL